MGRAQGPQARPSPLGDPGAHSAQQPRVVVGGARDVRVAAWLEPGCTRGAMLPVEGDVMESGEVTQSSEAPRHTGTRPSGWEPRDHRSPDQLTREVGEDVSSAVGDGARGTGLPFAQGVWEELECQGWSSAIQRIFTDMPTCLARRGESAEHPRCRGPSPGQSSWFLQDDIPQMGRFRLEIPFSPCRGWGPSLWCDSCLGE